MPAARPATSGYARIAQDEQETGRGFLDESDDDLYEAPATLSTAGPRYAPIQPRPQGSLHASALPAASPQRPGPRRGRMRTNSSGVDIKAINARLERWAEEIASKFKIGKSRGRSADEEQLEIHHSVFQPPEGMRPATADTLDSDPDDAEDGRFTRRDFEEIVESVRIAIEMGIHPKMISQGSSGSYFARNTKGETVGVFKPKDEEPYASRNPKWTKWIHRNLFPCFFGRACLIPNLSYVSEAAAYVLDSRLRTHLVPYTDIVYLSSKSFYYDFWDRRSFYRKGRALPPKVGSFQVFLRGYKDANVFLREHPWPDQHNSGFRTDAAPRRKTMPWQESCRPRGAATDDEGNSDDESVGDERETEQRKSFWTESLQQSFREELEKLVILDYIMRNTDRGLDNWMIKVNQHDQVSIVSEPVQLNSHAGDISPSPRPLSNGMQDMSSDFRQNPYKPQQPMAATRRPEASEGNKGPSMSIGAIDNSLSWPWKHPDAWRSFPFGWLFLPVSLIGQPFSQKARDHFLPLLTSTRWWSETQLALRHVFSQDSDFDEKMFARQIAVMKGQAWNVVETLKTRDHGPLELTRRARVCVWDDVVDIPVAVPLRVPSAEARRRTDEAFDKSTDAEEMDISAANASAPLPHHDLLGLGTLSSELPNPNRFELSKYSSKNEMKPSGLGTEDVPPMSPTTLDDFVSEEQDRRGGGAATFKGSDLSKSGPGPDVNFRHRRGASESMRRRHSSSARRSNTGLLYDDDLEGDLGYAAAEGMEKNQRKVIVERLEMVKSRNPVFTWC